MPSTGVSRSWISRWRSACSRSSGASPSWRSRSLPTPTSPRSSTPSRSGSAGAGRRAADDRAPPLRAPLDQLSLRPALGGGDRDDRRAVLRLQLATIAVVERRRELGLLRVIGMRRRGVLALVLVELVALSAVASVVGCPGRTRARACARRCCERRGPLCRHRCSDPGAPAAGPSSRGPRMLAPILAAQAPQARALFTPLEVLRSSGGVADGATYMGATLFGAAVLALGRHLGDQSEAADLHGGGGHGGHARRGRRDRVLDRPARGPSLAELGSPGEPFPRPVAMLAHRSIRNEIGRVAITCSAVLVGLAGTIAVATWIASLDAP